MTKRPTKPAKGVPMPYGLLWLECFWTEACDGKLIASYQPVRWMLDGKIDLKAFAAEHARVMAWIANPATPKGVRR